MTAPTTQTAALGTASTHNRIIDDWSLAISAGTADGATYRRLVHHWRRHISQLPIEQTIN